MSLPSQPPSRRISRRRTASTPVLTPAQTEKWVRTYGRHARIYAWSFFVLVLGLIFGLIWWEMGEVNDDVVYSFGFAATVTFLLAGWSRKQSTQAWTGVVEGMVRTGADHDSDSSGNSGRAVVVVRTSSGRARNLRLPGALCGYFLPGDAIFKISGLEWPEKAVLDRPERVCLACGNLYRQGTGRCPRCAAPEPDHETLVRLAGNR